MENLPVWVFIVISIIGAVGGAAGILSWIKAPEEIKKTKADAYETLSNTIDNLSERIEEQANELNRQSKRIKELENEVGELQEENVTLKRGVNRLVNQIRKAGLEPVWTPDNNSDIIEEKKE